MPDIDPRLENRTDGAVLATDRVKVGVFGTGLRTILRQFLALLGLALIVLAIPVGALTPLLPIGLPIAILGVVLLGRNAIWGRRWMEGVLARFPKLERFAPGWMMRAVFGREKRTH
jgi:drug/metabolite transporter (DMT)-like permease